MGFLEGIFGGGGTSTTTNTSTPTLSKQDQLTKDLLTKTAQNAFNTSTATQDAQGFAGPMVVGPSADTVAARVAGRTAAGQQTALAGQAANAANFGLAGALDIANNPYVQNAKLTSNQQLINQFMQAGGPLAALRSGSISAGGFGGSRQGIAEGQALTGLAQALATANAGADATAYGQGLNTYNQTLNSMPAISGMQTQAGQTLAGVGANVEDYQRKIADYESAMKNWNVQKDWTQANNLSSALYPSIQYGKTDTQTRQSTSGNLQDLGALMQMGAMGAMMFSPAAPAAGAAVLAG